MVGGNLGNTDGTDISSGVYYGWLSVQGSHQVGFGRDKCLHSHSRKWGGMSHGS